MFLLHQEHATDLPVDETHERHNSLTPSLKSRARATSTYGTRHASTCTREFWIRFARAGLSLLRSISIRSDSGKRKEEELRDTQTTLLSLPFRFLPFFPFSVLFFSSLPPSPCFCVSVLPSFCVFVFLFFPLCVTYILLL